MVHYCDTYDDVTDAVASGDSEALAVVAVLFEVSTG